MLHKSTKTSLFGPPKTPKPPKPLARSFRPKRAGLSGAQRAAYEAVDAAQEWCQACGGHWDLEHSHILTQKKFEHHRANPENILRLCGPDHALWENNKAGFKAKFPDVWARHLDVMHRLEPSYYAHFCMKFSHLV